MYKQIWICLNKDLVLAYYGLLASQPVLLFYPSPYQLIQVKKYIARHPWTKSAIIIQPAPNFRVQLYGYAFQ